MSITDNLEKLLANGQDSAMLRFGLGSAYFAAIAPSCKERYGKTRDEGCVILFLEAADADLPADITLGLTACQLNFGFTDTLLAGIDLNGRTVVDPLVECLSFSPPFPPPPRSLLEDTSYREQTDMQSVNLHVCTYLIKDKSPDI